MDRHSDAAGWESVFRREYPRLVAVCASLGAADPEEIAQEALVRSYPHRDSIVPGHERAYLHRAALNILRSRGRRKSPEQVGSRLLDPHPPGFESAVDSDIDAEQIRAHVRSLPDREREVIVLRYWAGLSDAMIAEHLAVPGGTVRSRLSRALRRLAHHVDDSSVRSEQS